MGSGRTEETLCCCYINSCTSFVIESVITVVIAVDVVVVVVVVIFVVIVILLILSSLRQFTDCHIIPFRCVSHPLSTDAVLCRNTYVFPGGIPRTVSKRRWLRSVENKPDI